MCVGVDVCVRVCGTHVCCVFRCSCVHTCMEAWNCHGCLPWPLHFLLLSQSLSLEPELPASGLTSELEGLFLSVKRYSDLWGNSKDFRNSVPETKEKSKLTSYSHRLWVLSENARRLCFGWGSWIGTKAENQNGVTGAKSPITDWKLFTNLIRQKRELTVNSPGLTAPAAITKFPQP